MLRACEVPGGAEVAQGRGDRVALARDLGTVGFLDEELVKDRGEQFSTGGVGSVAVELARVFEQVDVAEYFLGSVFEPLDGRRELLLDRGALEADVFETLADLGSRQRSFGGELDQALLLGFKLVALLAECGFHFPVGCGQLGEGLADATKEGGDCGCRELFGGDSFGVEKSTTRLWKSQRC